MKLTRRQCRGFFHRSNGDGVEEVSGKIRSRLKKGKGLIASPVDR